MNKLSVLGLCLLAAACSQPQAPDTSAQPAAAPTPAPAAAPVAEPAAPAVSGIQGLLSGSWRQSENVLRDGARHPVETLGFFGVQNSMTVIEITPGAGWYTELLAPYLRDNGVYIGAVVDPASASTDNAKAYYAKSNEGLRAKLAATPEVYAKASLIEFAVSAPVLGEPASADAVLTFRNVHNWMSSGSTAAMFSAFFTALKPGGVLGVVEHRANQDVPEGDRSGYVSEAQVIGFAEAAGFVLEEKSEINANPADTKDHPNGVWTLPPGLRVPEGEDPGKYQAIGESDRMTLRFRKPAAVATP